MYPFQKYMILTSDDRIRAIPLFLRDRKIVCCCLYIDDNCVHRRHGNDQPIVHRAHHFQDGAPLNES